jgi:hypothetical protein
VHVEKFLKCLRARIGGKPIQATGAYHQYVEWCRRARIEPLAQTMFGRMASGVPWLKKVRRPRNEAIDYTFVEDGVPGDDPGPGSPQPRPAIAGQRDAASAPIRAVKIGRLARHRVSGCRARLRSVARSSVSTAGVNALTPNLLSCMRDRPGHQRVGEGGPVRPGLLQPQSIPHAEPHRLIDLRTRASAYRRWPVWDGALGQANHHRRRRRRCGVSTIPSQHALGVTSAFVSRKGAGPPSACVFAQQSRWRRRSLNQQTSSPATIALSPRRAPRCRLDGQQRSLGDRSSHARASQVGSTGTSAPGLTFRAVLCRGPPQVFGHQQAGSLVSGAYLPFTFQGSEAS